IGDWIRIHVSIAHPLKTFIAWNQPDSLSEKFQKLSETKIDTINQENFRTENRTFTLVTFDTGALLIPPFRFFYTNEKNKTDSIMSSSLIITVTSVSVDTTKPFKGIKPNLLVTAEK